MRLYTGSDINPTSRDPGLARGASPVVPAGARLLARLVLEHYRGLADLGAAIPRPLSFRALPD
jgi:hypothetical protein